MAKTVQKLLSQRQSMDIGTKEELKNQVKEKIKKTENNSAYTKKLLQTCETLCGSYTVRIVYSGRNQILL